MSESQEQEYRPARAAAGMWDPSQRQAFDPRRKSPFLAAVLSISGYVVVRWAYRIWLIRSWRRRQAARGR